MIIGIDIDNTLSKSYHGLVKYFQDKGKDLTVDDLRYEGSWILNDEVYTKEEAKNAWYEDNDWIANLDLYPGAKAILSLLQHHELHLITARNPEQSRLAEATESWLKKHNFSVDSVTNSRDKVAVCKELGVDVMIEDAPQEIVPLAEAGIPVLMLDQPYNQDVKHSLVTRFTHWAEVPRLLTAVRNQLSPDTSR